MRWVSRSSSGRIDNSIGIAGRYEVNARGADDRQKVPLISLCSCSKEPGLDRPKRRFQFQMADHTLGCSEDGALSAAAVGIPPGTGTAMGLSEGGRSVGGDADMLMDGGGGGGGGDRGGCAVMMENGRRWRRRRRRRRRGEAKEKFRSNGPSPLTEEPKDGLAGSMAAQALARLGGKVAGWVLRHGQG